MNDTDTHTEKNLYIIFTKRTCEGIPLLFKRKKTLKKVIEILL